MMKTPLPALRSLLAFFICAQPAAAALSQAPVRIQTQSTALGLPALSEPAPRASSLSLLPSASLLSAPSLAPSAPALTPHAAPAAVSVSAPAPVQPAAPSLSAPSAVSIGAAVQDFSKAWGRGDSLGAGAVLEKHFDGSAARPAAPADPVTAAPAEAGETLFHGVRLPAAQFSEEGPGWLSSKLIAAIDAAEQSLDLALLEDMHRELTEAVLRAHKRGVKVRIVIDSMHVYPEKATQHRSAEVQALLDSGIPMRMLRGRDKFGLMHNKFAVLDGQVVWSGSSNWSRAADNVHQENATYTADSHRVSGFQGSWDWMWSLAKPFGQPAGRADGKVPPQDAQRPVRYKDEGFPAYAFAPGDGAEAWLLKAIALSRRSLDIAMFSCTSQKIKDALLEARARGVKVRLVFDKAQFRYLPAMMWFVDNGFDVLLGEGFRPGKSAMHHKFVVFDGELVQNGSYNWTDGAKFNNFENIQFWDDPAMAAAYLAAYERLRGRSSPIAQEDIDANRAAASERALEERGLQEAEKPGPGKLARLAAPLFGSRRLALVPFRRARA